MAKKSKQIQVPPTKKQSRINRLTKLYIELKRENLQLKRDLRKMVEDKVENILGDRYHMVDSVLKQCMLQEKLLIKKGLITQKEINKEFEELKKS